MREATPPTRIVAMNAPATLMRVVEDEAVMVARGPFVIMAHGLLAIPADHRDGFWIETPDGDVSAADTEAALSAWMRPASVVA